MLTDNSPRAAVATDLDIEALRGALNDELKRGEAIIRELGPRATPNDDPVAYMTTVSTGRVNERILAALDRIAQGTYGTCIRCGGAIVPARLEILPYAETCVDC